MFVLLIRSAGAPAWAPERTASADLSVPVDDRLALREAPSTRR